MTDDEASGDRGDIVKVAPLKHPAMAEMEIVQVGDLFSTRC